jgi:hypothetical protein
VVDARLLRSLKWVLILSGVVGLLGAASMFLVTLAEFGRSITAVSIVDKLPLLDLLVSRASRRRHHADRRLRLCLAAGCREMAHQSVRRPRSGLGVQSLLGSARPPVGDTAQPPLQ